MTLLQIEDLNVRFRTQHGVVQAVDGVSFRLDEGQTVGLVGESGSGKSVTNLALLGLLPSPPAQVHAKQLTFDGNDLLSIGPRDLRKLRGNKIAMIFQDPMTSLNPLLTIGRQLSEAPELHLNLTRRESRRLASKSLDEVGISNPEQRLDQYPHELSGGMCQRVMIAMALICEPRLLLADEPTTALDVTVQAQILELMADLQRRRGTAILMITHDLGVVASTCERVLVMYAGRLIESASTLSLFAKQRHPYTRGLLASIPSLHSDPQMPLTPIPGQPPDLADLPSGCAFAPRCFAVQARCHDAKPALSSEAHAAACWESEGLDKPSQPCQP